MASRGNLKKAQGRCVGRKLSRMAFPRTHRVVVTEVGQGHRSAACLSSQRPGSKSQHWYWCATLGKPLLANLSFLISEAQIIITTPLSEDLTRLFDEELANWRPVHVSTSVQHLVFQNIFEHCSRCF